MKKETGGNKTPPDEPTQQEFRRPSADGDGKGVPTSRYIKTSKKYKLSMMFTIQLRCFFCSRDRENFDI